MPQTQRGFALVDVMLASVVLSVAVIALVKLSQLSTQRGAQTQAYFHATAAASSLIASLRANPNWADWLVNHGGSIEIAEQTTLATYTPNCAGNASLADNSSWCASDSPGLYQDLHYYIQRMLSAGFGYRVGKAIICLRQQHSAVRVSVVWKIPSIDAGGNTVFIPASNSDCPRSLSGELPMAEQRNQRHPDRGTLDFHTRL